MRLNNIQPYECRGCGHPFDLHRHTGCVGLQWAPSRTDGRMEHGDCGCKRTREDLYAGSAA